MIRHVIDSHTQPIPSVLEIPSKDHPYDASKDSILRRARVKHRQSETLIPFSSSNFFLFLLKSTREYFLNFKIKKRNSFSSMGITYFYNSLIV